MLIDFNVIGYFIPYVYLFFSYFLLMRRREVPFTALGVFSAFSGLAATVIAIALSLIPPQDVPQKFAYELRLVGGCLLMVGIGLIFYFRAYRKT